MISTYKKTNFQCKKIVKNVKDAKLKITTYIIICMDRKANKMNINFSVQRVAKQIYLNKNNIIDPKAKIIVL
jgi:hypothetical protein